MLSIKDYDNIDINYLILYYSNCIDNRLIRL